MRPRLLRLAVALSLGAALPASRAAWAADRVAVLRFDGSATRGEAEAARAAARDAVGLVHDTLPSDAELAAGEAQVTDGSPDTAREYRAAGVAAGAAWTVVGHVDSHGWTYRLELEACDVSTGRVESLSREIDARQPVPQIAEMLRLLLRPAGVGNEVPPWEIAGAIGPPLRKTSPSTAPSPSRVPAPVVVPRESGDAGHAFGVGAGVEVLGAFARARGAGGGVVSGMATVHLAAEVAIPGFALIVDGATDVVGQASSSVSVGARYLVPAGPPGLLSIGPEVAIGAYFLAGDARLLSQCDVVFVVAARRDLDLELYPEAALAAGATGSLWLAGGGVRAVLRF